MPAGRTTIRVVAAAGCLIALVFGAELRAGDEDLSPSAYQRFDPVTGFTITVDPDAQNSQEHGPTDGQTQSDAAHANDESTATEASPRYAWLYWVIALAAGAGVIVWLRGKAHRNGPQ